MTRLPQEQMLRVLAGLAAVTPFAFSLLRAILRGHDLRFIWLAIATFLGALLVAWLGRARGRGIAGALSLGAAALVVATIFGALAIRLMMSRVPAGALAVALAFSLCFASSCALARAAALSQSSTSR